MISIGDIFVSNKSGKFKILGISHYKIYKLKNRNRKIYWYDIEFLDTGYKTKANANSIKSGTVYDYIRPRICGIGYLGSKEYSSTHFLYKRWKNMIERCYDKNSKDYKSYGAKGVRVDKRWHNFYNYVNDCKLIEGYDEELIKNNKLELDKDIKIKGNKLYSKDTCIWIDKKENNRQHAINQFENHVIIDTLENKIYYVDNLKEFCENNSWISINGLRIARRKKTLYKKRWYILYESYYNENKDKFKQYLPK